MEAWGSQTREERWDVEETAGSKERKPLAGRALDQRYKERANQAGEEEGVKKAQREKYGLDVKKRKN